MRIVLPLPPNMANKSFGHWAKKGRARDEYGEKTTSTALSRRRPVLFSG